MQVFKTDKKLFWAHELKSWLWTFVFAGLLYFGLKYFSSLTNDKNIVGVFVILFLKLGDTLTQYHVKEIQIDGQKKQVTVVLKSRMSGDKIKRYELEQATSELISNSGLTKYFSSPCTLKIFFKPNDTFLISNRYGFSIDTLTSVNNVLKSMKDPS
jgi:hypothetical protein